MQKLSLITALAVSHLTIALPLAAQKPLISQEALIAVVQNHPVAAVPVEPRAALGVGVEVHEQAAGRGRREGFDTRNVYLREKQLTRIHNPLMLLKNP